MSRDCGAKLVGVPADWEWGKANYNEYEEALPGITWNGVLRLAFADGIFPHLQFTEFKAHTSHFGHQKQIYCEINNCSYLSLCAQENGFLMHNINKWDYDFDLFPLVDAMYDAKTTDDLANIIDNANVENIESEIWRVFCLCVLAFNNNFLKSMRNEIVYA